MALKNYETIIVFSLKNGEESVEALKAKFTALIEKNGTLGEVEVWGKRRLAYDIDYQSEGYYVLYNYQAEPEFPAELDRIVKITDGVLRSLIVAKGE